MVYALRDAIGANLDRIQIVKGWLDGKGKTHEKVYDIAWSTGREPGADGTLPPVGNTVDIENANWTNTIGASELGAVWTDPDFDPSQSAFYYARVLEIPTPRWVVYDAFRFGVEIPDDAETTQTHSPRTAAALPHTRRIAVPGLRPARGRCAAAARRDRHRCSAHRDAAEPVRTHLAALPDAV
jgi:hypothetical protein